MSYIEKMTIQGIRSFGVSEQDRGMIMFFSPLTLILGPNGTGKTTIIECLKYMTTGNLPPGGKQDAAFIHDPKIARESEVKAQIRLLFRDVRGQKCMAIRSLIATQKKNKIEFKTLDSTITRQLANGEKQSISSKCAEMDSEMVSLLGVSKAILDNVIFCHQEDSTWPLSEGKALKQKFDDIFASTRYVKALDAIRKLRQDQGILIREYQIDIKHLKQYKEKAAQIASDLAEREERLKNAEDIVKKAEEKLMPVKAKLDQLIMKEGDMHKIKALIEKYKGEKMQVEKAQRDLRQNIHDEFRGSMEELKQELAAFENKVIEMERTLKQNQEKLNNLEKDLMNQSDERSKLLTEQGRLEQEAERHKQTKKNRDEEVQKLAQRYQLTGFSGSQVTDQLTQTLLTSLESRAKQLLDEAKAQRLEYEKKEADLQLEIDKVKNRKTKLETEQSMKQEKLRENRKEIQNINNELCRVDASANRLQDVDKEIRNAELMLEEAERSVDVDTLRSELLQLQKDKSAMDNTMKTLDGELTRLTQESSIRAQLDVYSRDRTSKEDQIKRLKAKNEDTLQHILGSVPSDGVGKALDKFLREHSRQLRTDTEQLQLLQKQLVEKTTKRNMQQDILGRKREELRNVETRITNATKGQEFDACISELQTNLQKNQDTKGYMAAVDCLYKKYIAKLRAHDPACPLCHRVFEEQSEVEELINEMEQKLNMVPEKLERVSSSIADTKADYERLLQLKPVYDSIKQLKEKEIPDLESDLQTLNSDIQRLSNEISEKEELVDVNKNDETVAKNMMSDATQIDRLQTELQDLIRKIDSQTARLAPGSTTRCLSEVQNQRSELQLEQELVNQKIDRKRQKLTDHTERVQQLKGSVTELRSERLQIETDLQKRTRLEENKQELTNANEILDREIREALEQVRPLQDRVDDLSEKKDQCSRTKEEKFEEGKEKCSKVRDHCQLIERFQMEIDKYVKDGRSDRLSVCRAKMSEMEQKRQQLESQKSTLAGAINAGQQDLARQKIHQRDLADNMQLRKLQAEVEEIVNKIKEEEVRLGGIDIDNLVRERNSLEKECKKLSDEKEAAKSRQLSLKGEISAFRRDLESDMYKDADKKYRDKLIELRTTELANVDLEKYYKALDATIMAYHNQKMAEINKIIQDLWRNTYRGNDIETIEIRSEEDEGSGAAKTRRNYRYRVVMIKDQHELDMRGRCSAGQKVLASLIIRLALSETFCLNCGILALDEPTTNLDRENIESLALALVEIIKNRQKQRNFQLVVITHDEDFVELLGRSDYVDEYFRMSKNEFGRSRLTKTSVQDLHHGR